MRIQYIKLEFWKFCFPNQFGHENQVHSFNKIKEYLKQIRLTFFSLLSASNDSFRIIAKFFICLNNLKMILKFILQKNAWRLKSSLSETVNKKSHDQQLDEIKWFKQAFINKKIKNIWVFYLDMYLKLNCFHHYILVSQCSALLQFLVFCFYWSKLFCQKYFNVLASYSLNSSYDWTSVKAKKKMAPLNVHGLVKRQGHIYNRLVKSRWHLIE